MTTGLQCGRLLRQGFRGAGQGRRRRPGWLSPARHRPTSTWPVSWMGHRPGRSWTTMWPRSMACRRSSCWRTLSPELLEQARRAGAAHVGEVPNVWQGAVVESATGDLDVRRPQVISRWRPPSTGVEAFSLDSRTRVAGSSTKCETVRSHHLARGTKGASFVGAARDAGHRVRSWASTAWPRPNGGNDKVSVAPCSAA